MTAKEYMKQAQRLLRRIDRKQKEADALKLSITLDTLTARILKLSSDSQS